MDHDSILVKIGKALQLAENAGTPEEKEQAFATAQKIASKYSIELATARSKLAKLQDREEPEMRTIEIGNRGQHNLAVFCELFMTIGRANDLKFNIAHNSSYVIAFGMPSDIEMTEALYASVLQQMMKATDEFIRKGDYKLETDTRWSKRHGTWVTKPIDSRVAKRSFWQSYTRRIGSRLLAAKTAVLQEIVEEEREELAMEDEADLNGREQTSTELVLKGKEVEVSDFYKQKSTARGSWKGSQATYHSSAGSNSGYKAANSASLGGEKAISGGRKAIR